MSDMTICCKKRWRKPPPRRVEHFSGVRIPALSKRLVSFRAPSAAPKHSKP